jgi:hypothetical protein
MKRFNINLMFHLKTCKITYCVTHFVAHFSMDPTCEQESLPLSHTQNDPILTKKQLQAH